jgi:hypothetical protein
VASPDALCCGFGVAPGEIFREPGHRSELITERNEGNKTQPSQAPDVILLAPCKSPRQI